AVLDAKASLDKARVTNQDAALRAAAGQGFYNTSKFSLRDLRSRGSQQQLKADFESYLDGFSPNVQAILENFEFRNQIPRLSKADALGTLIVEFLDPFINVRFGPKADIGLAYSIASSARAMIEYGNVNPITFAVLRLRTRSNFAACSTGKSAGLAPLKILSTKYAARRYIEGRFSP